MSLPKLDWWVDRVYPHAERPSAESIAKHNARVAAEIAAVDLLDPVGKAFLDCLDAYSRLLDSEDARRQSVEARLTTIMGLSSVAGTVVFGVILALAAGTLNTASLSLRVASALSALYVVWQVCLAVVAAVRGLGRRTWEALRPGDVAKSRSEDALSYFRRRAKKYLEIHAQHELQNNEKVSQLAVAYEAMKNFVGMLILFAAACSFFVVATPGRHDTLIDQLKRDHEIQDLLRGPQGPPGPKGDSGTPAPAAKPCPDKSRESSKGRKAKPG